MSKFRKTSLLAAAALAVTAAAAFATPAAAGFPVSLSLTNNYVGTGNNLTISGVSWSGSYGPQITGPILPGASSPGSYHTVLTAGEGDVTFTASNTAAGTACLFTFDIDNSTGNIDLIGAVSTGTNLAACGHSTGGSPISFTMAAP